MRILLLTTIMACGAITQLGAAQTPLAQAFQDLRSSDPAKVQKTKATLTIVLKDEWPTLVHRPLSYLYYYDGGDAFLVCAGALPDIPWWLR